MGEMIVVTNIEYVRVPRSTWMIRHYDRGPLISNRGQDICRSEITDELIEGQRFLTPDGDTVIGIDKEISNLFQVHWEELDEAREKTQYYWKKYEAVSCRLTEISHSFVKVSSELRDKRYDLSRLKSSFWNRFKFLFTGEV